MHAVTLRRFCSLHQVFSVHVLRQRSLPAERPHYGHWHFHEESTVKSGLPKCLAVQGDLHQAAARLAAHLVEDLTQAYWRAPTWRAFLSLIDVQQLQVDYIVAKCLCCGR